MKLMGVKVAQAEERRQLDCPTFPRSNPCWTVATVDGMHGIMFKPSDLLFSPRLYDARTTPAALALEYHQQAAGRSLGCENQGECARALSVVDGLE